MCAARRGRKSRSQGSSVWLRCRRELEKLEVIIFEFFGGGGCWDVAFFHRAQRSRFVRSEGSGGLEPRTINGITQHGPVLNVVAIYESHGVGDKRCYW